MSKRSSSPAAQKRASSPAAPKRAASPAAPKRAASPAAQKRGGLTLEIPSAPSPRAGTLPNKSGLPGDILARTPRPSSPSVSGWKAPLLPPAWVVAWFALSAAVCLWDASFVLLRPLSMPGGSSYAWIWSVYHTHYMPVDGQYGALGWKATLGKKDMWNVTQSWCNIGEIALGMLFLLLVNYNSSASNIVGIVASTATAWKTVIYFALEALSGWKYTKHNDAQTFWLQFVLPSSIWIIMPVATIVVLSAAVHAKLSAGSK